MTRNEFTEAFRSAAIGLPIDDVARECGTSRATIQRWYDGLSTPHAVGRESVLAAVRRVRANTP